MTDPGAVPFVLFAGQTWGGALHAMRSARAAGARVLVATAGGGAAVYRRSRACDRAVDLPDGGDDRALARRLRSWVEAEVPAGPVVVLPTSDRLLDVLHRNRDQFPSRVRLAVPEPAVADALLDKARSLRVAERAGLDVPPWVVVRGAEDRPAAEVVELPVAIRPTAWATGGEQPFKIAVVRERDQLRSELDRLLAAGAELIVQSYVEAPDDAVELAVTWRSRDRRRTEVCTGRKRRQASADGGVMVWGETAELPDVADDARRFLDESGFTGIGGIELIRQGEHRWFIEFNPRLEAIHFLAARAGTDVVDLEYHDLAGRPVPMPGHRRPASAWVGAAFLARMASGPGRRDLASDWWAFQRSPGRVRAVWSWADPAPALVVTGRLLGAIGRRAVRR